MRWRQQLQRSVLQQVLHCGRRRAIAIAQLSGNVGKLRFRLDAGHAFVHAQPLVFLRDVFRWNADVQPQVQLRLRRFLTQLALQFAHRALQHGGVELEADGFNVSTLLAAEQVTCAAQFQIERGNLEARAEVAELLQSRQPAPRKVGQIAVRRNQQVRIRAAIGAADAPAQLV